MLSFNKHTKSCNHHQNLGVKYYSTKVRDVHTSQGCITLKMFPFPLCNYFPPTTPRLWPPLTWFCCYIFAFIRLSHKCNYRYNFLHLLFNVMPFRIDQYAVIDRLCVIICRPCTVHHVSCFVAYQGKSKSVCIYNSEER